MYYCRRDQNGNINGLQRNKSGKFQEKISSGKPEVVSFLNPPEPTLDEVYDQTMKNNKPFKAMAIALNKAGAFTSDGSVLPDPQLKNIIKAEM